MIVSSIWNVAFFAKNEKVENPGKSYKRTYKKTQLTWDSYRGHIGGRLAISQLCHPCALLHCYDASVQGAMKNTLTASPLPPFHGKQ